MSESIAALRMLAMGGAIQIQLAGLKRRLPVYDGDIRPPRIPPQPRKEKDSKTEKSARERPLRRILGPPLRQGSRLDSREQCEAAPTGSKTLLASSSLPDPRIAG